MIPLKKPYFMNNRDWYYHDKKEHKYKLTEQATKKATESYKEFYRLLGKRIKGL